MSNNEAWLVLSFAIMIVAVLATLYEKFEQLEKRVTRLEVERGLEDDEGAARPADFVAPEARRRGDERG